MLTSFRGISLRQVWEQDLPFVFRLFTDPARNHLWSQSRRVVDERQFLEAWNTWMNMVYAVRFIVESGGRPVGLVLAYDHYPEHGYAKVGSILQEESEGHGTGLTAGTLLIDYLFRTLPLRKVYLEGYGFNPRVARILRKLGLQEEGCLKESYFWDGAYWDLHIFALTREGFPAVRARILRTDRPGIDDPGTEPRRNGRAAEAHAATSHGRGCSDGG